MDRVSHWKDPGISPGEQKRFDLETRVMRNRLVNLSLDWELTALTLDAQRYKSCGTAVERESLRDSANTYGKCVAELAELLSKDLSAPCKAD
jgi:hypothetical protein